jgi:hypothetical protein
MNFIWKTKHAKPSPFLACNTKAYKTEARNTEAHNTLKIFIFQSPIIILPHSNTSNSNPIKTTKKRTPPRFQKKLPFPERNIQISLPKRIILFQLEIALLLSFSNLINKNSSVCVLISSFFGNGTFPSR